MSEQKMAVILDFVAYKAKKHGLKIPAPIIPLPGADGPTLDATIPFERFDTSKYMIGGMVPKVIKAFKQVSQLEKDKK